MVGAKSCFYSTNYKIQHIIHDYQFKINENFLLLSARCSKFCQLKIGFALSCSLRFTFDFAVATFIIIIIIKMFVHN